MSTQNGMEIAVIGMSGRFPGSTDVAGFWNNLKHGVESISFFNHEALTGAGENTNLLNNPNYVSANSCLPDKEFFDSAFFNYRPDEARLMDPQIRIFHECVWKAMEDAGYNIYEYDKKIGLFASGSSNPNWMNYVKIVNTRDAVDPYSAGQLSDSRFLCSRLSFLFNFRGPSVHIDTACSSSLVAIRSASMSLLLQECKIALAGGVSINNCSNKGYLYQEGMIRSKDGHTRTFDKDASGTVGGEGAGVVVLKRLKDAIEDRDNIYAVIKGSSVNNDGYDKVGYTAPSISGQAEVIIKARKMARIEPESIGYVEAHGTATVLGDPIEVEALNQAFGKSKRNYCALGSVKTNIGHLDTAAGVAGFIKAVLALKYRQIPPSLHFNTPNPKINFSESPFYVNTELKEWKNDRDPLRAGVSSFGIGGTNAHVILEEAPEGIPSSPSRAFQLLNISAKTPDALKRNVENLKRRLQENNDSKLSDISFTLNTGRCSFKYRTMLVCEDNHDAIERLSSIDLEKVVKNETAAEKNMIVFMFPGQGSQYVNMCSELYENEQAFRIEVDRCFEIINNKLGKDLKAMLFSDGVMNIDNTECAQPALFIVEYALARLLVGWGIKPDMMIGHSIGEYVAACLSGVFTLEDALTLVVKRGEMMQVMPKGSMLAISISEKEIHSYLKNNSISLATVNSSSSCVVSGSQKAITSFKDELDQQGILSKELHTSHAFHSHMMDEMLDDFEREVKNVKMSSQRIPIVSNLTGNVVADGELGEPKYWVDHLRKTVKFSEGIEEIMKRKNVLFIEVGPGKTLGSFVGANKRKQNGHKVINLLGKYNEPTGDIFNLLSGLGKIWLNGVEPDWKVFYANEDRQRVSLPSYSFDKIEYPANVDAAKMISDMISDKSSRRNDILEWFYTPTWKISRKVLAEASLAKGGINLVFGDECGISTAIVKKLKQNGEGIIYVRAGKVYKQESIESYVINPNDEKHYQKLFKNLSSYNIYPDKIIHCWGIIENSSCKTFSEGISKFNNLLFYSLLNAVKIMLHANGQLKDVTVLTNDVHNIFGQNNDSSAFKSMTMGLLKVIGQEYPSVTTGHIDISLSEDMNESFISKLFAEIKQGEQGKIVSYRNSCRWVQVYDSVQEKENNPSLNFKNKGVYLITGGLGEFGYVISKYLSKNFKAKLILLGREQLPLREKWNDYLKDKNSDERIRKKIEKILSIENQGGEILYLDCDVSVQKKFSEAVEVSEKKFGKLNGVFHAAGVTSGKSVNSINQIEKEDFDTQFSSKIFGLVVIYEALKHKELDFCLLTSSLASILGGLRFAAYSSANIFMDYFVRSQVEKRILKNWVCVNFDAINFEVRPNEFINNGELPDVINYVLSVKELGQVAVSTKALQRRVDDWVNKDGFHHNQESQSLNSDNLNGNEAFAKGLSDIERELLKVWRKFFGKSDVGLEDDFFEIGGDSLKAMTLITQVSKQLNFKLSLIDFFEGPTIKGLATLLSKKVRATHTEITKASEKDYYVLSSAQRRMYFLYEFDRESLAYNLPQIVELGGILDGDRLGQTFKNLIFRHESLRTSFRIVGKELVQNIHNDLDFKIEYYESDILGIDAIVQGFIRPFDLSKAPLIRVGLIKVSPIVHLLMVDMHHIISDGISQGILIKDFMALYDRKKLPEIRLHYKDYSEWQQGENQRQRLDGQRKFWLEEFEVATTALDLPTDFRRPSLRSHEGNTIGFSLSKEETNQLKALGDKSGATMFMTTLSVFNVLLAKLSNQEDIAIGTPVAGREHADLAGIMGMFVNTLVLRNYPNGTLTFTEFLSTVKRKSLLCFDNQSYQYEELIDELNITRDTSRNPLFDVMFVFNNFEQEEFSIPDLTLKTYDSGHRNIKFDLTMTVTEWKDQFHFKVDYSADLFSEETIKRFVSYFSRIVRIVNTNANIKLCEIDILLEEEKDQLLNQFNDTEVDYSIGKTIVDLFEDQVERTPDKIAIIVGDKEISFSQLNNQANFIAQRIFERTRSEKKRIGLLLKPSIEMIVGILGVLKSASTYVPMSTEAPIDRNKFILRDCEADLLLVHSRGKDDAAAMSINHEYIIEIEDITEIQDIVPNPKKGLTPSDSIYIIYTSGSTGLPKGVEVTHKGVVNYALWRKTIHDLTSSDVTLQLFPYYFDGFGCNFFPSILSGGSLVMIPEDHKLDIDYIINSITKHKVTNSLMTPSVYELILTKLTNNQVTHLRFLELGGEKAKPSLLEESKKVLPDLKTFNEYGPTEMTIASTYHDDLNSQNTNIIGKPIFNTSAYILNKYNALQPINVPGELCISGAGIAKRYVNNIALTEQKFVANPFKKGERLYKTGDLARRLPDGNIEFLGRIDDQVKIRGFRIELGEIESQLVTYDKVKETVVIAKGQEGDEYLVGYYVSDEEIDSSELRSHLSQNLPDYMLPSYYVHLGHFPLTANGKIDKKGLPDPEIKVGADYVAPSNETEAMLVVIWSDVLGLDKDLISVNKSFFELGGNSLSLLTLVRHVQSKLHSKISLNEFFRHSNIKAVAKLIEADIFLNRDHLGNEAHIEEIII